MAPANIGGSISKFPRSDFWFVEVLLQFFNSILPLNGGQCRFCQLFLAPIYLPYYRGYPMLRKSDNEQGSEKTRRNEQFLLLNEIIELHAPEEYTLSQRVIYAADSYRGRYETSIYNYLGKNESFKAAKRFLSIFIGDGDPLQEARKAHNAIVKYYTNYLEYIFEKNCEELENRTNKALKKISDFHETVIPREVSGNVFSRAAWVLSSALVLAAGKKGNLYSSVNSKILEALFNWPGYDTVTYSAAPIKLQLSVIQLIGLLKSIIISDVELETICTMVICIETAVTQEISHPDIATLVCELDKRVAEIVSRKGSELKDSPMLLNTEREEFETLRNLQEALERIKKVQIERDPVFEHIS